MIPDYVLERYLLGELPAAEMEEIRQRLESEAELRERLQGLERSNEELNRRYPPAWMSGQIERKLKEGQSTALPRRSGWRPWLVPAAVALLAVVVVPRLVDRDQEKDVRLKGAVEPQLVVFRKVGEGSEQLEEGSLVRQGDVVQIAYRTGAWKYGAILSVDGRGMVTLHLPAAGERAVELGEGKADTLDFAYELDDAPRWERFYLVVADHAFALRQVRQAMDQAGGEAELALPEGLAQTALTLRKADPQSPMGKSLPGVP
jgi:hypothetical protein